MSDENKADNDEWQIDSLEEEDEIIELTDEIEPPPLPKETKQDQLDEIVIDLDDDAMPSADEEVHESMEAAVEDIGFDDADFDELAALDDKENNVINLVEETQDLPEVDITELTMPAMDDSELDESVFIEDTGEDVISLEDETEPAVDDDMIGFKADGEEDVSIYELEPFEGGEETVVDLDDGALAAPDAEIQELMTAGIEDASYEETEPFADAGEDVIELGDDILPAIDEEAGDDVAEIGLEGLLPEAGGEEIGMPDIETEVDIDEVADLEPIIPETIPEMEPEIESEPDMALQDPLTADLVEPVPSPSDEIIEISEFDQQYFDNENPDDAAAGLHPIDEAEEDDFLELIDVDEEENDVSEMDDEIIHLGQPEAESDSSELDDLLSDPDHTEIGLASPDDWEDDGSPELTSQLLSDPPDETTMAEIIPETDDGVETESVPSFFESSPVEDDLAAGEEDIESSSAGEEELAEVEESDTGSLEIPAAISAAQIEAAVATIIERDYAGQIENMVASAIEKVVSLEIERIKTRLFDDDQD